MFSCLTKLCQLLCLKYCGKTDLQSKRSNQLLVSLNPQDRALDLPRKLCWVGTYETSSIRRPLQQSRPRYRGILQHVVQLGHEYRLILASSVIRRAGRLSLRFTTGRSLSRGRDGTA